MQLFINHICEKSNVPAEAIGGVVTFCQNQALGSEKAQSVIMVCRRVAIVLLVAQMGLQYFTAQESGCKPILRGL